MEKIILKDKGLNKLYKKAYKKYGVKLNETQKKLLTIIMLKYKKYSSNEYFLYFTLLYGLLHFKIIDINQDILTKKDKKYIKIMYDSFIYEMNGEKEKFLDSFLEIEEDLLVLKLLIKQKLLIFEKDFTNIIPQKKNYYKSMGYIIPILTLKRSKFLGFYQDYYFKKNFPKEYYETKRYYIDKIGSSGFTGEYLITILEDLNEIMFSADIIGRVGFRKKSYFSLYNKMQIKKGDILDFIGARIIFNSQKDIYKFCKEFEKNHISIKKKDYIKKPKANGYKSMHYTFISTYKNLELLVELQLRTRKIHNDIRNTDKISHYNYTIKENKWNKKFEEVIFGYNYIKEKIKK